MHPQSSPFEAHPPSRRRILISLAGTVAAAALIVILFVLPAEYGVDPTGVGSALGLTALGGSARTLEFREVIEGNERVTEFEVPDFGEPVPLPNPAVHQERDGPPRTEMHEVVLGPGEQTEIKLALAAAQAVVYTWRTDGAPVYSDFHGHDPAAGDEFWVRYREHEAAASASGSLVAPFAGEHGWYWVNFSAAPVTITLEVRGFHDDAIDYGIF